MKLHRNSQKRIYLPGRDYFVTTITKGRIPFFRDELFVRLLFEIILTSQQIKKFMIHGLVILEEHWHMLFRPSQKSNISDVLHNIKRNFAYYVNFIMRYHNIRCEDEDNYLRLHTENILRFRLYGLDTLSRQYNQKYGNKKMWPKFQWQHSFYDHYIRDAEDFDNHLNYILCNPLKHKTKGYVYIPGYLSRNDVYMINLETDYIRRTDLPMRADMGT